MEERLDEWNSQTFLEQTTFVFAFFLPAGLLPEAPGAGIKDLLRISVSSLERCNLHTQHAVLVPKA